MVFMSMNLGRKIAIILGSTIAGLCLLGLAIAMIICLRRNKTSNDIEFYRIINLSFFLFAFTLESSR